MIYEEFRDALDGLYAYDSGATDSGIKDESLRNKIIEYLESLSDTNQRILLTRVMHDLFVSDDAIAYGYGWEDAKDFGRWLEDGLYT